MDEKSPAAMTEKLRCDDIKERKKSELRLARAAVDNFRTQLDLGFLLQARTHFNTHCELAREVHRWKKSTKDAREAYELELVLTPNARLFEADLLSLEGDYDAAARMYIAIFLAHPEKRLNTKTTLRAVQAFRRCEYVDESLRHLQELMETLPKGYREEDVAMFLGLTHENSKLKGSKRTAKEAFKYAYSKLKDREDVKMIALKEDQEGGLGPLSFGLWRQDPETWKNFALKCRQNGDFVFAVDFYTKALWTPTGQADTRLWTEFAELTFAMGDRGTAIRAIATVHRMLPFDLNVRAQLWRWDDGGWGNQFRMEEFAATKMQALVRGVQDRKYAAEKKRIVYAACYQIHRIWRGALGRKRAAERRVFLWITQNVMIMQRFWRKARSRLILTRLRLERDSSIILQSSWRCYRARIIFSLLKQQKFELDSSITLQCTWRSFVARRELANLRRIERERRENKAATFFQSITRGRFGREIAREKRRQRNAAVKIQKVLRGSQARKGFSRNLLEDKGARGMQRICRGFLKRKWFQNFRNASARRIQTCFRRFICFSAFPSFKKEMRRYERTGGKTFNLLLEQLKKMQMPTKNYVSDGEAIKITISEWLKKNNREATSIWIQNIHVGSQQAKEIAQLLEKNHESLSAIGFGKGCDIGAQGAHAIAEMMRCHNYNIERLHFDHQHLGDEGVVPIMKTVGDFFFGRYSRLHILSLNNTGLGNLSLRALSEGLELNTKLKVLHLNDNLVGDAGVTALSTIFMRNSTLEEIGLANNQITSAGASALTNAIRLTLERNSLLMLDLEANLIGAGGGASILKCIQAAAKLPGKRGLKIRCKANPFSLKLHSLVNKAHSANNHRKHVAQPLNQVIKTPQPENDSEELLQQIQRPPFRDPYDRRFERLKSPYLAKPFPLRECHL